MTSKLNRLEKLVSPAINNTNIQLIGRVYMLHGWAQNEHVFLHRTKTLCKRLNRAGFDCIYLRANMELPPLLDDSGRQGARAWFLYDAENPSDRSKSQTGEPISYIGLEQSLELLGREFEQVPPNESIHVLGFSQGAVLAHILAALASSKSGHPAFSRLGKFVLISGFSATPTQLSTNVLANIDKPSLHIFGSNDTSVLPTLSEKLANCFLKHTILTHDKGHVVPQQSEVCASIIQFLLD